MLIKYYVLFTRIFIKPRSESNLCWLDKALHTCLRILTMTEKAIFFIKFCNINFWPHFVVVQNNLDN